MEPRDPVGDVPPSLWPEPGKCPPERGRPQALLIPRGEKGTPEPKAELGNDASRGGRTPEHSDATPCLRDVLVPSDVEDPGRVVVPVTWPFVGGMPTDEFPIQRVAQYDLEALKRGIEGSADRRVPFIQVERLGVPAAGLAII